MTLLKLLPVALPDKSRYCCSHMHGCSLVMPELEDWTVHQKQAAIWKGHMTLCCPVTASELSSTIWAASCLQC